MRNIDFTRRGFLGGAAAGTLLASKGPNAFGTGPAGASTVSA